MKISTAKDLRAILYVDSYNTKGKEISQQFKEIEDTTNPNAIITFGGDGTFLHAFHQFHNLHLPFLGVNCGNVGYLLNPLNTCLSMIKENNSLIKQSFSYLHITATYENKSLKQIPVNTMNQPFDCDSIETCNNNLNNNNYNEKNTNKDNDTNSIQQIPKQIYTKCAFNDVWIQRKSGQCCWFEVLINGEVKIPKITCDGIVICTASGSTGYSKSIGISPIPCNVPLIGFVPNNASYPLGIKPFYLPLTSEITINNIQPVRRPSVAFFDGIEIGDITSLQIKVIENGCDVLYIDSQSMNDSYTNKIFKDFQQHD